MSLLVLLAALAQAPDGGVPASADAGIQVFDDPIYAMCPDAPPATELDGGWLLISPERTARLACGLVTCETNRRQKSEQLAEAPPPYWWVYATTAVLIFGALGFAVGRATAPPPQSP